MADNDGNDARLGKILKNICEIHRLQASRKRILDMRSSVAESRKLTQEARRLLQNKKKYAQLYARFAHIGEKLQQTRRMSRKSQCSRGKKKDSENFQ